jgi:hypothetical protein
MKGEKEMYEYSPNSDKKSEKLIFSGLLVLSAIFFIGSKMPSMPLTFLFQLLSVCLLAIALIGAGSTLFCRYVYCLERSEGEYTSSDLVIYRVRGARRVAVCRVACAAVSSMTLVTKENRRALMRACKGPEQSDSLRSAEKPVMLKKSRPAAFAREGSVLISFQAAGMTSVKNEVRIYGQ